MKGPLSTGMPLWQLYELRGAALNLQTRNKTPTENAIYSAIFEASNMALNAGLKDLEDELRAKVSRVFRFWSGLIVGSAATWVIITYWPWINSVWEMMK